MSFENPQSSEELYQAKVDFYHAVLPMHDGYTSAPSVKEHTKHVDVTTLTAPSGTGKNTVMSKTGLWIVTSDTNRIKRINDGVLEREGFEYHFRGEELEEMYKDIINGQYVQWAPGPDFTIYGSRDIAYPKEGPALIDVVAKAIPAIRELRQDFASIESAFLVTKGFAPYMPRLLGRGQIEDHVLLSRLEEGHDSLVYGLESAMHFIVNDDADVAAKNLVLLAQRHESLKTEAEAQNYGYDMLVGIREVIRDLRKKLKLPVDKPIS